LRERLDSAQLDVSACLIADGRGWADRPADVRPDIRADVSAHCGTDVVFSAQCDTDLRIERRADRESGGGDRDLCQRVERWTPNVDVGW
jgi:hypothetical protein